MEAKVPFKTPVDYFKEVLCSKYENVNRFKELLAKKGWDGYDCDLHIYPYVKAKPGMLSIGCPNQCPFCPTAHTHRGYIHFGNYEHIISQYADECIHFMDENFFYNKMDIVLPLLKKWNVQWLAMSDYKSTVQVMETFGEDYLYECGLRIIEIGLENIVLYKKVKKKIKPDRIAIYYLNMTCLPGETKSSILENAKWMKDVSLKNPIHFNNGVWYACGQFLYPYKEMEEKGQYLVGEFARVLPTWIPYSLLVQDYTIINLERANHFNQYVYGWKMYNPKMDGNIDVFIGTDQRKAAWMLTSIRCGAIV